MSDVPDPNTFEDGDFVWPKPPGRVVMYLARPGQTRWDEESEASDEERWERDKRRYLAGVRERRDLTTDDALAVAFIEQLTYAQARRLYLAHDTPLTPMGSDSNFPVYVGHVAIIWAANDGHPRVVEAVGESGVRAISYSDWLSRYKPGTKVWHARLKNESADARRLIPTAARQYEGRPFEFWNFNLEDATAFYCSKLVWLSIRDALNVAVDDQPNPRRWFWFSPKQLMHVKRMEMLFCPEPY